MDDVRIVAWLIADSLRKAMFNHNGVKAFIVLGIRQVDAAYAFHRQISLQSLAVSMAD